MNNMITITTEDGKEVNCEILFTYHSDDFNNDYVVFMDPKTKTCGACIYIPTEGNKGKLEDIKNDEEWEMLQDVLDDWLDKNQDKISSCGCGDSCDCGGNCDGCDN